MSGLAPNLPGQPPIAGKVGADFTAEQARDYARNVGLNLLAVMQDELGDLMQVKRIVKLLGMVNAVPHFTQHPYVIDGCSTLLRKVFPHLGPHARTAMGVSSLPNDIPVEIEAVIEVI